MDFLNNDSQSQKKEKGEPRKEKSKDVNKKQLGNYRDPITKISLKKLRVGLWYVKYRPFFRKAFLVSFVLLTVGMWIYAIVGFGWYIFKGMKDDEKMINELTGQGLNLGSRPQAAANNNLTYSSVTTFIRGGKYDLMVKIKNPEKNYRAKFKYCFMQRDEELECKENFIFPEETKYILSLSNELDSRSGISFNIKDINWDRIDFHKIPDWERYKKEHLNFDFTDIDYNSGTKSEYSDKINLNSLEFDAENNTSYGYWNVDLNIILYDSGKITGVNRYTINRFNAGDKEKVELVWPGSPGRVTDVSIIPDLDIMEKNNYIKPRK
jgi:hypothetical protein